MNKKRLRRARREEQKILRQDRYGVMNRVYYKDAHGAVVVVDGTRERTKEGAVRWKNDLDQKVVLQDGGQIPAVLVINKCDLDVTIKDSEIKDFKEQNGFIEVIKASAKENYGIEEALNTVMKKILANEMNGQYDVPFASLEGHVRLENNTRQQNKKRFGCC
ncbi:unnamed protein product [Cylicocyclus nassatus]|uniref:Uncharacterized protein n=1 Tax=Cylicocyclus nassatus TaxID=53992 RepID=A0AA36HG79_CYLNA|nr:unnamed protein product [Cylicocyclus nassatus]